MIGGESAVFEHHYSTPSEQHREVQGVYFDISQDKFDVETPTPNRQWRWLSGEDEWNEGVSGGLFDECEVVNDSNCFCLGYGTNSCAD